jgi:Fe-S oxidoreductase
MALEAYRNDMIRCVRCSVCKFIPLSSLVKSWRFAYGCPASARYHFHSYSGGGKLIAALSLIEGRIDYSDALLDIVYKCTMCGACDLACRIGTDMEPLQILRELRFRIFEKGKGPLEAHKPIMDSIRNYDNVWLQPRSRRASWAKGLKAKDLSAGKEKAEVLYYAGCTYSFDSELQKVARNTVTLLQKAGVDVGILGNKERCCASPAFQIGDQNLFEKYALENIKAINKLGVSKVVTSCAGCYGLFKTHYELLDKTMNFKVLHAVEYLDELIKEGRLTPKKRVSLRVTYHDPCHLRRGQQVWTQPRNLLILIDGLDVVELPEADWCCGSAGSQLITHPETSRKVMDRKLDNLASTRAEVIAPAAADRQRPAANTLSSFNWKPPDVIWRLAGLVENKNGKTVNSALELVRLAYGLLTITL